MTQKITRKDGIVYERRNKKAQYDNRVQIRLATTEIEKLKEYAAKENMTYTSLVRELIEDFIERECK